jgi:hypothetical protein
MRTRWSEGSLIWRCVGRRWLVARARARRARGLVVHAQGCAGGHLLAWSVGWTVGFRRWSRVHHPRRRIARPYIYIHTYIINLYEAQAQSTLFLHRPLDWPAVPHTHLNTIWAHDPHPHACPPVPEPTHPIYRLPATAR